MAPPKATHTVLGNWGLPNSRIQAWLLGTPGHGQRQMRPVACTNQLQESFPRFSNEARMAHSPASLSPSSPPLPTSCSRQQRGLRDLVPVGQGPAPRRPVPHPTQYLLDYDVMCSCLSPQSLVFLPINKSTIHQEYLGDPKAPLVTYPGPNPGFLESPAGGPSPFHSPVSAL